MANWLTRWDPFKELEEIRDAFDKFFGRSLALKRSEPSIFDSTPWVPSIDMVDKKDSIVVKAEIPGADKKNIKVNLQDGVLTIKGEIKKEEEEKKENYYCSERYYGSFLRSIDLPVEVEKDKVKASYKDGVLTITLPKSKQAETKETEIPIE
ncbi:MAG: Hsp20/alpha crystallin family protein [Endomicrobiia bacterium]